MKKILQITSSLNNNNSLSSKLSESIIDKLSDEFPNSTIIKRNLGENPIQHLTAEEFTAFAVMPENRTEEHSSAVKISDELAGELLDSDIIVIGVPLYNFGIPSVLKSWIDHIARAGITFKYSEKGAEGLVRDKKVFLAISSGGVYTEGAMKSFDFTEPYLRAVLGFLGLKDVTTFRIEGISYPDMTDIQIEKGFSAVSEFNFRESSAVAA